MAKTIADELAKKQQSISVSEFFTRNRHLLGFDNPRRALLTTIKEAVDNSLDACQEAKILPIIKVKIKQLQEERYLISITDNGPGIVKKQIPFIFARLLYGSKFFKLAQSLTHDEPVMVKRKGKIELSPIGDLIANYIKNQEGEKEVFDLKVPCFDKSTHSYKFRKVSQVIKHKRRNEIIKVKLATNREIKVTGCHSLFTSENGIIKEVEARKLKQGDKLLVPSKLPEIENLKEINILDYISLKDIEKNWMYVYNIPEKVIRNIKEKAEIIHKKTSKSRRFYRIKGIDILDDSLKQYETKQFLPLHLIYKLNLKNKVKDCIIKTYQHGKETTVPITLPLTKEFIKFLGFYVAEGHFDKRQIGLTFGKQEDKFVNEIINFSRIFGLNFTIEPRETIIRIKLFGNIFTKLIKNLCGKGAKNKKIPEFIFRTNQELRQTFLDALYQGDGHNTKNRNQLMLTTSSKKLANETLYLWLMQGVLASIQPRINKGLGKFPSKAYSINVYGKDIEKSKEFSCNINPGSKRIVQQLIHKDLSLLQVKEIEIIKKGYEHVYDLSVPYCENFVGGLGGISCHNTRGQQGIGISAAVLYGQLTTGKPARIISKIGKNKPAHYYELKIDTKNNEPEILVDKEVPWDQDHGINVEIEMEAIYQKGIRGVDEYLKQTVIANPHAELTYIDPENKRVHYPRASEQLPVEPKEIKPHPHGIELGIFISMLKSTSAKTLTAFLTKEFIRLSSKTVKKVCEQIEFKPSMKPKELDRDHAEKLYKAIQNTKLIAPPTNCLSPIGAEALQTSMEKEIPGEFFASVTRPASVYRGNPFQIETCIAFGGQIPSDKSMTLLRFANRVPLQYQQSACAITKSVIETNWRNYNMSQSRGALPVGPVLLVIHMASVWVPFTSESKEAIAHYPEIIKQIKLAIQECGRKLASHIRKTVRVREQKERAGLFEKFIPEIASSLNRLTKENKDQITSKLTKTLKKSLKDLIPEEEGDAPLSTPQKKNVHKEKKEIKKPTKKTEVKRTSSTKKVKKHGKREKQTTLGSRKSR
ncbi:MAG: DNA topoisomerase VI subunit B [Nanoarchaeota archaeon]|nr:DNA topoisomerase VI subunit B [Nanoarchaeota archaeon]|tara:strand:- start:48436 stop:51555 length:3120 start_codon:yes stop_codon:yes gene_type:complete